MARLALSPRPPFPFLSARDRRLDLRTLPAATGGLGLLLPALDARLHVVTAHLELTKHSLGGKLALEHLDGALDPAVADDDLERLALNGIARHGWAGLITRRAVAPTATSSLRSSGP